MNKIQLNKVQQTLEAVDISGCIVIDLDNKPPLRLNFFEKIKIHFDIIDNSQILSDGCHLRALAQLDHGDTITGLGGSCECAEGSSFQADVAEDYQFFIKSSYDGEGTSRTRHVLESAVNKSENIHTSQEISPQSSKSSRAQAENEHDLKEENKKIEKRSDYSLHSATSDGQNSTAEESFWIQKPTSIKQTSTQHASITSGYKYKDDYSDEESLAEESENMDKDDNQKSGHDGNNQEVNTRKEGDICCTSEADKTPKEPRSISHYKFESKSSFCSEGVHLETTLPQTNQLHPCSSGTVGSVLQTAVDSNISKHNFTCPHCLKKFPTSDEKRYHHRISGCVRQCVKCSAKFSCEADLFIHHYKNHDRNCLQEEFSTLSIKKQNITSIELQCPICCCHLYSVTIQHHLQTEHFTEESYSCCLCASQFKTDPCLQKHLQEHSHDSKNKRKLSTADETYPKEKKSTKRIESLLSSRSSKTIKEDVAKSAEEIRKENALLSKNQSVSSVAKNSKDISEIKKRKLPKSEKERKNYRCKHCTKTFCSQLALHQHKQIPSLKLSCPKCHCVFPSEASLIVHDFQVHEKALDDEIIKCDTIGTKATAKASKRWGKCPLCLETNSRLVEHVAVKHTGERLYQCCVCGDRCCTCNNLRRHCDKHLKEREGKIKCSKCPFETNSRSEFFRHATIHRTQCEFCKADFGHVHLLWSHYESEHAGELFSCKLCGKKKATKVELENHMKNHRFLQRKPCPICGVMIKGTITKHFKKMHPDQLDLAISSNKRPAFYPKASSKAIDNGKTSIPTHQLNKHFSCPKCKMTGFSHQSLMQHLKSQSCNRIPCPLCNRSFTTPAILTKHIDSVHLNIAKHVCDICGKRTSSKYNLKVHKRIHSLTKVFSCDICGQGFNYKASLKSHMKSIHRDDQSSSKCSMSHDD